MKQQQFWMDSAVVGLSFVSLDPVASFARFATDNPVFSNTPKPFALCAAPRRPSRSLHIRSQFC